MTLLLIPTLLFSAGLCSLSSSVPRQFHVVKKRKIWTEAQQYCREKFTDLATIDDMSENEKVKSLMHDADGVSHWIGLKRVSSHKWRWSLAERDFYIQNEEEFRNWAPGQPVGQCVDQTLGGNWYADNCSKTMSFICYDGGNSTHVLVTERKTWRDAQRYCRENHTDLTSVRSQAENDQIKKVRGNVVSAWVGLFSDAWEWSDGSSSSFRHWKTGEPNLGSNVYEWCTSIMPSGQWNDQSCAYSKYFICYEAVVKRQIVRVEVQTGSQENINDPAMLQAFLQQIQQRLRERGMPADAKLTWMRQPDGKVFQEKKNNEK